MSAHGGSAGGGGPTDGSAGGGSADGGSAGDGLYTVLHAVPSFSFHNLINLPGTNWFIGVCGQSDDFITRVYLIWFEKNPSGDFKGKQSDVGNETYHVNSRTSRWEFSGEWNKKPKKEPGIHYHDRNFYPGLPIMVVPILSMMNHFILLTNQYIYFFRINPQNKLEVIHTIEASSEAERRLYKSCAISANGQIMVVHHNTGFSVFRINMNFGQFQVDLFRNVELPPQNRNVAGTASLGDVHQVKITHFGVVIWYESGCLENGYKKSINVLFPTGPNISCFSLQKLGSIRFGHVIKFFEICHITPTEIGIIVGEGDCILLLMLSLENLSIRVGGRMNRERIQKIVPCSVNSSHFFVAAQNEEVLESICGYNRCRLTPIVIEIAIRGDALVQIGKQSFKKGGVSKCSYLTSFGGIVIASFLGDDYRARLSVIGETTKVESSVQPPSSQSTLNGAPIGLLPNGVVVLLPDRTLVSSNADNGLTLFGPDGKPVASSDPKNAHKSPITRVFPLEVGDVATFSSSDGSIQIWSIQKRGETVHIRIVATISTTDFVLKKGVKFLALYGQTLLIVTNQQELLRFRVEIAGIRAEIRPIPGPVVQMEAGQICQGIAAINSTHAIIYVATSGVRECSLVLASFVEGAAEMFKSIGTRKFGLGKPPAAFTSNGFAISAVDPTKVCSTALSDDGVSSLFYPKDLKDGKLCDATILEIVPCESGFICITANGFLFQFVYDAQQKPVLKKQIAVLKCALTPKCWLQVSGDTVMVCQPRDDGSVELLTFKF
jgi:hypothetical protein